MGSISHHDFQGDMAIFSSLQLIVYVALEKKHEANSGQKAIGAQSPVVQIVFGLDSAFTTLCDVKNCLIKTCITKLFTFVWMRTCVTFFELQFQFLYPCR